ncbi:hypothetical protein ANO11243_039090 [Dothideomycetidae sp. 11243]|nr:hypothetical protein ANO11243_039090 [fungal sp. No.11243]
MVVYKTHATSLIVGIRSLRKTAEFSDLTITCGGDTYRVHKAIICPQSQWFSTACEYNGIMDRPSQLEIKTGPGIVEVCVQPYIIDRMIGFLYGDTDYAYAPSSTTNNILIMARLSIAAHQYEIQSLKDDIIERLTDDMLKKELKTGADFVAVLNCLHAKHTLFPDPFEERILWFGQSHRKACFSEPVMEKFMDSFPSVRKRVVELSKDGPPPLKRARLHPWV